MWKKRKKSPSFSSKIPALIIIIIFAALVFGFLKSGLFNIKRIDTETENLSCTDQNQIKNASGLLGQNFFFVNSQKTQDVLKKKFICIKSANISKIPPDKIKLKISNRQVTAVLAVLKNEASLSATPSSEDVRDSYVVDNEGIVFGKGEDNSNIPRIFISNLKISMGEKLKDGILNAVKILEKIKTLGLSIDKSWISDNNFVLYSGTPVSKIIFRLNDGIDIQLASLQLILDKAKIDSKELEFIDLRFDKPVVRFAPQKRN